MSEPLYKSISAKKKQQLADAIPAEWKISVPEDVDNFTKFAETTGVLSAEEIEITGKYDAVGLLERIHKGEYTALQVTIAFCKRAALASQCVNCVAEMFFDRAYETAKKLDSYFAEHGKPIGPLHGLPVSIKDSYNLKGVESAIGIPANAFKPEPASSTIVEALEEAGAVLYVKTVVPQSMMVLDTENNLIGPARNPHSKYLTAAGSSGGAGSIVAFRGSLVGMATDIGGSIRVPAYCAGAFGMKPSSGRLPYYNIKNYWPDGEEATGILCVDGPITTSARDLELIVKSIVNTKPWLSDPTCARLPWVDASEFSTNKIKIGVVKDITLYEPIKSIYEEFIQKLTAAGYELVDVELLKSSELAANASRFYQADGGKFLLKQCEETGEPLTNAVQNGGLYPSEPVDMAEFFQLTDNRQKMQKEWLEYWNSTASKTTTKEPIDLIICPSQPALPRPKEPLTSNDCILAWNTLDYPASVVPIEKIDLAKKTYKFEFPKPVTPYEHQLEAMFPEDRSKSYDGFHVGIQVIGRRQFEESVIEASKTFADIAGVHMV
ncbi:amidase signature domain-containing protein [Dipodascopsis uninucleata]